jgi:predicted MFS family arabinose efflux permease
MGIAQMVVQTPAGYLTDRVGRRPMLWAGWAIAVLSVWIFALADNIPVFVAGLVVNGLMAVGWPAQYSYIAASVKNLSTSRAFTLMLAFSLAGTTFGSLLSSRISEAVGLRTIYWLAAGVVTVSLLIILGLRPQPVETRPEHLRERGLLKNRLFGAYLGLLLVVSTGITLPFVLASNYLEEVRGLTLNQIGALGAVAGVGNVVVLLVAGSLKPRLAFVIGQVLLWAFAGLLWLGQGFPAYGVAYFCLGGAWLAKTIAVAMSKEMVPGAQAGLAFGITETVLALALMIAPFLAGVIYQASPVAVFSTSFLVIGLGLLLTLGFYASLSKLSSR